MTDFSEIAALADGTLTGAEASAAQAAVAQDPAAKAEYESLLHLKKTLQEKLPSHTCPTTLSLCQERIRELRRVHRTESLVGRYSYAMAAVVFVSILGAAMVNRYGGGFAADKNMLQRSLSASVVGGSSVAAAPDSAEAWLMRELKTPRPGVLKLTRMDVVSLDGRLIGRRTYTDGALDYTLLEMPGVTQCCGQEITGYPGLRYTELNGANAVFWTEGATGFVLSANVPLGSLLNLLK